jgi:Tim10/DDP family zinc finger
MSQDIAAQQQQQQQLMQLNAIVESQKMLVKLTSQCFRKCVPVPGKELSSREQSCLWKCGQNSIASQMFMQKRLLQRSQSHSEDHN